MAAPVQVDDEVVVYGDPFARWDHTRWSVQTELMLPLGATLAGRDGTTVLAELVQIRAMLLCDKDVRLGKKKWEVNCEIEDVSLQAVATRWGRPADLPRVARVLEEIDERITGIRTQLQVDSGGGVPNVQLEGLDNSNTQDNRRQDEALRAMVAQVVAGFHLKVPDQGTRVGVWEETEPTLMRIPGLIPSAGSSRMVHTVSRRGDHQYIQTLGEGMMSLPLTNGKAQNPFHCSEGDAMCADLEEAFPKGDFLGVDAVFDVEASGVALFDRSNGVLSERVWEVSATGRIPGSNVVTPPYINRGRLTLLGEADRVDVGPTTQLSPPGHPIEGLPRWQPLEAD